MRRSLQRQRAVVDTHFAQLPFKGSKAVVAAAKEQLSAAARVANLGLAEDLRIGATVQIHKYAPALAYEDHVMPCSWLQNSPARQNLVVFCAIEEKEFALGIGAMRPADSQTVTAHCPSRAVHATRKEVLR